MARTPSTLRRLISVAAMVAAMILVVGAVAPARATGAQPDGTHESHAHQHQHGPPDRACERLMQLQTPSARLCTHGPDAPPPGVDITRSAPPVSAAHAAKTHAIQCDGKGESGYRTEVIYARAADVVDRYDDYLDSFRVWAVEADQIYQTSAAETGGYRRLRFVHDAKCNLIVRHVVLSSSGDDDFGATITELQALGYNRADRKYMIFVDASVYCGIGTIYDDDQPGEANANNWWPSYGRIDAGCWMGWVAAHEHMHNIGGVQLSAPNTSGGWHCVDEFDVMCYSDYPYSPTMTYLCTDTANEQRFDCNHDDYYSTQPEADNYLATHWNAANSLFLLPSAKRTR